MRFEHAAQSLGLHPELVQGAGFAQVLFVRTGTGPTAGSGRLHVYLDGDGTPLIAGRPADDPTPRNPLVLRLLARDPAPALYLGRPCYHGIAPRPACAPSLWTDARYGETVVASMAAALRSYLAQHPFDAIWWFGYSGGGALAMLLAERFRDTEVVVTIAGNLDLQAFARRHGVEPLAGSLDPATRPPLPARVLQRHYLGADDQVIPTSDRFHTIQLAGFDHRCCWETIWPALLADTAAALDASRPGAASAAR